MVYYLSMQRRLFLQLLGVGGAAATILPLFTTEASAQPSGFQHWVIREGSYTGRIFDGSNWLKGTNAGFPSSVMPWDYELAPSAKKYGLSELDKAPHVDMEGALKATQNYRRVVELDERFRWPKDPRVGERIGQGLALFRGELKDEIEGFWERSRANPEGASLVTMVQDPLTCRFGPEFTDSDGKKIEAQLTISLHRRHFILEGRLKPGILWSDSGRIPLDDDFLDDDLQHFRNDQRRNNVVLVDDQNIPENTSSNEDLSEYMISRWTLP